MTRKVSSRLEATVIEPTELVLSVATTRDPAVDRGATERMDIAVNGRRVEPTMVTSAHGTRLHVLRDVPRGDLIIDYRAELTDSGADPAVDLADAAAERIVYLRPSRYCESDTLAAVAATEFAGLAGKDLVDAVSCWVGRQLAYVSGSSRHTDGAVQTYLARQGVCRDFAHLVVTLLRARGVPARLAAVYAPGLAPMDFHAVAEAYLADDWFVVDATALAPRQGMVRIATGRDASDTAFLTVLSGQVELTGIHVRATMEPELAQDDITELVRLP